VIVLLIQFCILLFLAGAALALVLTRAPRDQTIGLSFYGLLLAVMFFVSQAPDVALSQIVVGAVALPMLIMLGLAEVRRHARERERESKKK
jgi:energy-converting hydrogenase B subunit D